LKQDAGKLAVQKQKEKKRERNIPAREYFWRSEDAKGSRPAAELRIECWLPSLFPRVAVKLMRRCIYLPCKQPSPCRRFFFFFCAGLIWHALLSSRRLLLLDDAHLHVIVIDSRFYLDGHLEVEM
jgi:hypothetical protein